MLTSKKQLWSGLVIGTLLVLILMALSISVGITEIPMTTVIESFINMDGSNEHLIIQDTRISRTLLAVIVGASLAIAGAMMQSITGNPLASPATLGVNAGASLFIVSMVVFWSISAISILVYAGFFGAFLSMVIVYILGSGGKEGLTPLKLTLAGAAIAALFTSMTQGLLTTNERGLEEVLFWLTGSVQGRKLELVAPIFPFMIVGMILAFMLAKSLNVITMGDDVAKGLGQRTGLTKLLGGLAITLLAGGAVAVAGPIVFVGLTVPHLVKGLVGHDHRWIIPYCVVVGAILLLVSDIGARFIMNQKEIPVGIMTAVIGTPFFIWIARRKVGE
ncbi:FecCD family ABC transporter permease [Polycladospora coralii]